ncbi:hypothetical protein JOC78_001016 [Bacillus ectoiniformans]|uniref:hypothetical protein n=1 Tax=Bacillus ectoiniformans TaxID=1494429 RepID=UPI00195BF376|nr:hypothetical protein [Bacillus ectoiniformans]MBM7648076.1 hypothetical protein [Bacillus ectoiniformans]
MKKAFSAIIVSMLALSLFLSFNVNEASAAFTCSSTDVKCKAAKMYYGEQQYVASGSAYFNIGETILFEWDNDNPGIMQVNFSVRNSAGTRVSKELVAAGRIGSNFGTWTVTSSGYYYLFAACEGGNDTRCVGGGVIKKF